MPRARARTPSSASSHDRRTRSPRRSRPARETIREARRGWRQTSLGGLDFVASPRRVEGFEGAIAVSPERRVPYRPWMGDPTHDERAGVRPQGAHVQANEVRKHPDVVVDEDHHRRCGLASTAIPRGGRPGTGLDEDTARSVLLASRAPSRRAWPEPNRCRRRPPRSPGRSASLRDAPKSGRGRRDARGSGSRS